jgi:bifunctional DNA-binding transcriptional regulator/antitoxin component of YhaV-PrlF toxin-antitoxin module
MRGKRTNPKKSGEAKRARGFSEDSASYVADTATPFEHQAVELGAGGRLVIPAPMRAALGMKIGDRLTVQLDGNQLRIYTFQEGLRQAREIFDKYLPKGVDPVEDFLRWKREQAALEEAKLDKWSRDG